MVEFVKRSVVAKVRGSYGSGGRSMRIWGAMELFCMSESPP